VLFSLLHLLMIGICWYEFHPPDPSSVATLPCEILNTDDVKLQQEISKENDIKFILASTNCHVPYICVLYN